MPVNALIIRGLMHYFAYYGDNGAGIGASHQTGWTGIVALMIEIVGKLDPQTLLAEGRGAAFGREIKTA